MKVLNKKRINLKIVGIVVLSAILLGMAAYVVYSQFFEKDRNTEDSSITPPVNSDGSGIGSGQRPVDIDDTEGKDVDSGKAGVSSNSGAITLKSPEDNELLDEGTTISGEASVDSVTYRIIDNSRGVIAENNLAVKDSKFSAKINGLSPYSNSGILQIFSLDPNTLQEINLVQVDIRLSP